MTQAAIKSKISYYDVDQGKKKVRRFSKLELVRMNDIFTRIEDILYDAKISIRGNYISVKKCKCPTSHTITRFIVEI